MVPDITKNVHRFARDETGWCSNGATRRSKVVTYLWWGEATDGPDLARQLVASKQREDGSITTTAREYQPSPGFGATGARPTEMANLPAP